MDWLTDRIIEIIEDVVGGKVYSLFYNAERELMMLVLRRTIDYSSRKYQEI